MMKKLEVLQRNRDLFGDDLVLPYVACYSWPQIKEVALRFEQAGNTWGMRTDWIEGKTQKNHLPFLMDGSLEKAKVVWDEFSTKLVYIVSHNILNYRVSGVACPVIDRYAGTNDELVFIEYNPTNVSQRAFDQPENIHNVKRVLVGPFYSSLSFRSSMPVNLDWWGVSLVGVPVISCTSPLAQYLRFDKLYHLLVGDRQIREVAFSVRNPDGKLVIW
jgi:hypothetical protein